MSRKRTRESLLHTLTEPCVHCEGKGYTKSRQTVSFEVLRELRRQGSIVEGNTILIEVHAEVAKRLQGPDRDFLDDVEKRLQKQVVVKVRGAFAVDEFEIRSAKDNQVIGRSEVAHVVDKNEVRKTKRKRRGSPDEVMAQIEADEAAAVVNAESMADEAIAEAEAQAARVASRDRAESSRNSHHAGDESFDVDVSFDGEDDVAPNVVSNAVMPEAPSPMVGESSMVASVVGDEPPSDGS
jgi:hypothetical protein